MCKKTFTIHTLGCKVNQQESDALATKLCSLDFALSPRGKSADVVIVNSCSVTSTADAKTRKLVRKARKENPAALIALLGCYPQVAMDEAAKMPEVDLLIPSIQKQNAAQIIAKACKNLAKGQTLALSSPQSIATATATKTRTRAYLKACDGCDRFCAYCVVPYARGAVKSKTIDEVVSEAAALLEAGYKEIVLTGINLALFGAERGESDGLYNLLSKLSTSSRLPRYSAPRNDECFRIRLTSLEPTVINARTAARIATLPHICPHFHLSLQSGSAKILKAMGRPYTPKDYMQILDALRKTDPLFGITTDIIVGFPGETEEDFSETYEFAKNAEFSHIHVFPYSPRPFTKAAGMPGQVPNDVKTRRAHRLLELSQKAEKTFYTKNIGQTRETLIFGKDKNGTWRGITDNGIDLRIPAQNTGEALSLRANTLIGLEIKEAYLPSSARALSAMRSGERP